jgi:heat shock protein HslJ
VSVTATTSNTTNLSGTYVWIETVKENRTIVPKAPGVFSITFTDGTVNGTTDCNGFSGSYSEENGVLSIGSLGMTKMFCEGSQEMEYTQQFVGELTIEREGRTLFLVHADGTRNQFEAKE